MEIADNLKKTLFSTPLLKVLDFLLQHPDLELNDTEISGHFNAVGKSAVNLALRKLAGLGLVVRTPRGRMMFNRLVDSPLTQELKVASNLMAVQPLIENLKALCIKIVLFGSRSQGTHTSDSDYDLFIVASNLKAVLKTISKDSLTEIIQPVIKTPEQALTFKSDEPVLSGEIKEGKVIWERE